MSEQSSLFSLMSSVAAKNPKLSKEVDELEYFNEFSKANLKIEKLNDCSSNLIPSDVKLHVGDMLYDISDEKFKQYLDRPSIQTDASSVNAKLNPRDVEFFETRIKDLKIKLDVDKLSPETVLIAHSIEKQLEDVKNAQCSLERLFLSLNKLKSSMNKLIVDPKLNENIIRDLAFEHNVKSVCEKINDLNKVRLEINSSK